MARRLPAGCLYIEPLIPLSSLSFWWRRLSRDDGASIGSGIDRLPSAKLISPLSPTPVAKLSSTSGSLSVGSCSPSMNLSVILSIIPIAIPSKKPLGKRAHPWGNFGTCLFDTSVSPNVLTLQAFVFHKKHRPREFPEAVFEITWIIFSLR